MQLPIMPVSKDGSIRQTVYTDPNHFLLHPLSEDLGNPSTIYL